MNIDIDDQLFNAVRNDDLLTVRELIANGADVNCSDRYDSTPLFNVKSIEMAQLLVLNGADVNYSNNTGTTPLHTVDSLEMAQFFVSNGAYVNSCDNNGSTPLFYLDSNMEILVNGIEYFCTDPIEIEEIVKLLILNGADVNYRNHNNCTPLHNAKSVKIMQILVANGADVNNQDCFGDTPLHYKKNYGNLEKAKILLENGADMHIKNNVGISAYDCAIGSNNNELIELFEQYNAISNGLDIKEPCVE